MLADYFSREDFTNHSQYLNTNPELIYNENILPITTRSPTIELHDIHYQVQRTQDPNMKISESTFLCEQRSDPEVMKIIDSINRINCQILN